MDPRSNVFLACAPRLDITKDAHLGQVHRLMDSFEPAVVFIGPLYRLTPRAITSDDDAAPLLAALDTIRDRGVAMVMEAHAGHVKDAVGDRDLRPRGSAALMGWPEFGMGIRLHPDDRGMTVEERRGEPERFQLTRWRGDRDVRAWPKELRHGSKDTGEMPWVDITPKEMQ
jgi:replicative DNA helicase